MDLHRIPVLGGLQIRPAQPQHLFPAIPPGLAGRLVDADNPALEIEDKNGVGRSVQHLYFQSQPLLCPDQFILQAQGRQALREKGRQGVQKLPFVGGKGPRPRSIESQDAQYMALVAQGQGQARSQPQGFSHLFVSGAGWLDADIGAENRLAGADGSAGGVAAGAVFRPGAGQEVQEAESQSGLSHAADAFGFIVFGETRPGQGVAADLHQKPANFLEKGLLFLGLRQGHVAAPD